MPTNLAKAGNKVTLNFVTSFPIIGDPTVNFKSGGQDVQNNNNITYNNPTDRRTWEASYDVDSDDDDGVVTFTISGTDYAGTNHNFTFTIPSPGVTIDTTLPTVTEFTTTTGDGTYKIGDTIPIKATTSENILSGSKITVTLNNNNSNNNTLDLTAGSAGNEMTGTYTVGEGDNTGDLTISSFTIVDVKDTAGNEMTSNDLPTNLIFDNKTITIDGIRPTITKFTSNQTENIYYYKAGDQIQITANTSEDIQNGNSVTVTLDTGGPVTLSAGGAGDEMTGTYTVSNGDNSTGLTINSFTIGTVKDTAGNDMTLTTLPDSIFANTTIVIDTTPPTISSVSIESNNDNDTSLAKEGNKISLTFTVSEQLNGDPVVQILGYSATKDNSVTAPSYKYTYTVISGDTGNATFSISSITDLAGNQMSGSVTNTTDNSSVTIDTTSPTVSPVSIESNNDNDTSLAKEGDTIILTFIVSETLLNDPTVQILGNSATKDNSVTAPNYKYTYTVASGDTEGPAAFSISVTDKAGNVTSGVNDSTDGTNVTVDTTPPNVQSVSIESDNNNTSLAKEGDEISLTFTVSELLKSDPVVQILSNSATKDSGSSGVNYTYTYEVASGDTGNATFSISSVTDKAGNQMSGSVTSTTDNSSVTIDTTKPDPPVISTNAQYQNTTTPIISGTAEANSFVEIYNGTKLGDQQLTNGGTNWSITLTGIDEDDGYTIFAQATDAAGNTSDASSFYTFTVDTTKPDPPTFTQGLPTLTNDSTPTISGTAEANSTVKLYDNTTEIGSGSADPNGDWSITTSNLTDRQYNVTAKATDAAGNTSDASSGYTFTVDTTEPQKPTITTNAQYQTTTTPTISGTAEANSTVKLYDGTTEIGSGSAAANGTWSIQTNSLGQGSITVTATATDAAGNISDASDGYIFTVDTSQPSMTITSTTAGVNASGLTTNDTSIDLKFETNEVTTNFVFEDIDVSGGSLGTLTDDGSGKVYTATLTTIADGTYTIDVDANKFTDAAGNGNTASNQFTWTRDTTAPTFSSVSATGGHYKENDTVIINVNFSEAVQISGTPSLTLSNQKIVNYSSGSGSTTLKFNYTVGAAGTENTTNLQVNSMSGTIKDSAGNTFSGTVSSNHLNIVIDNIKPSVVNGVFTMVHTILNLGDSTQVGIVFSEKVQSGWYNFITTDDGEMGGTFGTWSSSNNDGITWSATFTAGSNAEGPYKFELAANDYQDLAGNTGNGNASGPQYIITDPNS